MTLKIKGAFVRGKTLMDDLFDVSVDIFIRDPYSTFFHMVVKDSLKDEEIVSIRCPYPEGHLPTENNWTDLLVMAIQSQKDSRYPYWLPKVKRCEYHVISTQPNVGMRFFRFHGYGSEDLVLMVEYPDNSRIIESKKASDFHGFRDQIWKGPRTFKTAKITADGVLIGNQASPGLFNPTLLKFKNKLGVFSQLDVYLKGSFLGMEFKRTYEESSDETSMYEWKSIGLFSYLKSNDPEDGWFGFTFHRDPLNVLIKSLGSLLCTSDMYPSLKRMIGALDELYPIPKLIKIHDEIFE